MKANVFNIERYATEDGPGIRTVIFLKGCTLRCKWCANPESQEFKPENLLNINTCISCGKCQEICPNDAIRYHEGYGFVTNQEKCTACMKCVGSCLIDSRKIMGTFYENNQLMDEILKDEQYFKMSGGGVTFSGGEPFYYPDVIRFIAERMREKKYTTLVETCGYVPQAHIQSCAELVDYIYYDFKHIDAEMHKKLTGKDNELIIKNLEWLCDNFTGELSVRYPYIPGCNSDEKYIKGFLEYIKHKKSIAEVIFLPYHRLGLPKYHGLGRSYEMNEMKSLKKDEMIHLYLWAEECGVEIKIQ